jgi:two-component system nitrogen regulation sensor histidine kinase NtrY
MLGIIAWQVTGLWLAKRRQVAGAQLHTRIVGLFSVIAVVPAILLAVFASISLDQDLDRWFSTRTKSIIQNSIDVATAYLQEHGEVIRADTVAMAKDIDEAVDLVKSQPQGFGNFLQAQAAMRALPMAYLIDGQGKLLATAASLAEFPYRAPPQEAMNMAKNGQVIVIAPGQTNMVGAIKSLQNFNDTYLYVIRPVNARVLQQLRATRASVAEYQLLEQRRAGVQVAFGLMYVAIALTLLLSAIWIGMWFANRLVAPIRELMGAAQEISHGNLGVEVGVDPTGGDLAVLGSTFNTMTSELKSQRDELVGANTALDERRRFMEAVLSGVTAGVVGVDSDGIVTLVNRSAETLLGVKEANLCGNPLAKAVPEFGSVLKRAQKQGRRLVTDQIALRRAGSERNFAVRVTSEGTGQAAQGYVVTFDDMTELVSAQRSTAWADVARRIAHEIKNPLTPIQLSAERIRRKYGDSITKDREVFDQCTDTIIRQVSDIGRMVDEFSAFARMPKPQMERHDVREIVREAVFLFQVSRPEIKFELDLPDRSRGRIIGSSSLDPGRHQSRQERERGDRHRRGDRPHPRRFWSYRRQSPHHRRPTANYRDRQWLRATQGEPRALGRALHDHARERYGAWPRDRAAHHGAAWRYAHARRCAETERKNRRRFSAYGLAAGEKDETRIAESTAALEPSQADATEAAEKEEEGVTHGV